MTLKLSKISFFPKFPLPATGAFWLIDYVYVVKPGLM